MTTKGKAMLQRARRLSDADLTPVVMIVGDPEIGRKIWTGAIPADSMASERECLIGTEVFAAEPDELTKAFHARMCRTARERGKRIISLGFEPPAPAPAYPAAPVATETVH